MPRSPNSRRDVLAWSAVAVAGLSGCLQDRGTSGTVENDGTDTDRSRTGSESPTERGVETATERGQRAPPESYPDYGEDFVDTIGYDAIDLDDAPIYLEPSARRIEDGGSIVFSFENPGDEPLLVSMGSWRVHKRVDGEWVRVASGPNYSFALGVGHPNANRWAATFDKESVEDGEPARACNRSLGDDSSSDTEGNDLLISGLGGGDYAFGVVGFFEEDGNRKTDEKTAYVATFEFDADPLELTPTNAIETTDWDGDMLVVTTERGNPDDEHVDHRLGAYELERLEEPPVDATRVITEQVVRNEQLRDTLALAREYDARRVRLEEYNGTWPIFGVHEDEKDETTYEYRGSYYEVSTEVLEE